MEYTSGRLSKEEMEKSGFGEEYIKILIPKKTVALIVTTISETVDKKLNMGTKTYTEDEIEKIDVDKNDCKNVNMEKYKI